MPASSTADPAAPTETVRYTPWGYRNNLERAQNCTAALAPLGSRGREFASLALNAVVTICSELSGYVHGAALRTALVAKGKLEFNANLRLFKTGGKWYSPNGAVVNVLYGVTLVIAYTAASLVFAYLDANTVLVSWIPVFVLGIVSPLSARNPRSCLTLTSRHSASSSKRLCL